MVSGDVIRYRVNSMSITRAVALTQRVSGCPTGITADLRGLRMTTIFLGRLGQFRVCSSKSPMGVGQGVSVRSFRNVALIWSCLISTSVFAAAPVDLTGTYNVATLTPLERPEAFGNNLYLSREEANKISAADAAAKQARAEASNPDRGAPPSGGDGSAGAAGNVGGYNTFWIDNGDRTIEIDGKFRTSILTYPANGRRPALTAAAQQLRMQRIRNYRQNSGEAWWLQREGVGPYDDMELRPLAERCILGFGPVAGPPMFPTLYNNLKRIVQTENYVMILAEMVHDARVIRLNAEHKPAHIRTWMGDSIGWWEGTTLVVETTNFVARPALNGADENLRVIERFTRIDNDTLNYAFTVEDATVWSDKWSGEYPWPATNEKVYEYACHEGNYAMGNIMRGARLLEAEARTEAGSGSR